MKDVEHWKAVALRNSRERRQAQVERDSLRAAIRAAIAWTEDGAEPSVAMYQLKKAVGDV